MARDPARNAAVAHILYAHFIHGTGDVKAAARRCSISPSQLYDYCENKQNLPTFLIEPLCRGDIELYSALTGARELGFVVSKFRATGDHSDSTREAALELGVQSGRVLDAVLRAEADGHLTDAELECIENERERLQRVAEHLGAVARRGLRAVSK